jgi:hypothetical protein
MISPESNRHFRKFEPPIDIPFENEAEAIRARGKQLISPFWALSRVGTDGRFTPEGRKIIAERLKASKDADRIGFRQTTKGLRFPARNIDYLISALNTIYLDTDSFDALTAKAKREIDAQLKETLQRVA